MASSNKYEESPKLIANRKFTDIQGRLDKALIRLTETIDNVNAAFSPVIGPEQIYPECENIKEPVPPQSELERFVASVEARIHTVCESLNSLCERSSV